jgi:fatty acid desaturase
MINNDKHLVNDLENALDADNSIKLSRKNVPIELLQKVQISDLVIMVMQEWLMLVLLCSIVFISPLYTYPIIALLIAGRYHALGVILHDATHLPLRRKSLPIRFVEILAGYPIATTLNAMRYHHIRHHRDSGMKTDPYYKSGKQNFMWWVFNTLRGGLLVPFWNLRAIVGGSAFLMPQLRNFYGHIFLQDRSDRNLRNSKEVRDCAAAEWGQIVFIIIITYLTILFPFQLIAIYFLPVSITGILSARRLLLEHNYKPVKNREIETIMDITNDNHIGLFGKLFFAPRNIGYHTVHHIHPQVRLSALPELRLWYIKSHPNLYRN